MVLFCTIISLVFLIETKNYFMPDLSLHCQCFLQEIWTLALAGTYCRLYVYSFFWSSLFLLLSSLEFMFLINTLEMLICFCFSNFQVWASGFSAAFLKKYSVATKGFPGSVEPGMGTLVGTKEVSEQKPALTEAALLLVLEKFFGVVLNFPGVNR